MKTPSKNLTTRREFIKSTSKLAATSALVGTALPHVHAAGDNTIKLALVGCGGRGTSAVGDAFWVQRGPVKLVAMADIFDHRLKNSFNSLNEKYNDRLDVPEERKFLGFDAYKKAIDCLRPGDVVLLTTPPAFRWVHFTYAIEKGVNVFMEKPVTVDGPTTRRMLELAKAAKAKNLKVGVGLMIRHCRARQELHQRIRDGQIGNILLLRAYRMSGPSANAGPNPGEISDLLYQIQKFHSFIWASGGVFSDYYIHQIDECCWMKNAWPVQAHALGGRHYRGDAIDQNLDTYSVEYTFEDGTKFFMEGRNMYGCHNEFASYAHGHKGLGIISTSAHSPGRCRIFTGQNIDRDAMTWAFPQPETSPYRWEWDDLIDAIRNDKPYNEVERGAIASMVTSMGRFAAHTGQVVTFDEMMNHDHEFAPDVDKLTYESPSPLQKLPDGTYPVPMPGILKNREYGLPASA